MLIHDGTRTQLMVSIGESSYILAGVAGIFRKKRKTRFVIPAVQRTSRSVCVAQTLDDTVLCQLPAHLVCQWPLLLCPLIQSEAGSERDHGAVTRQN